jgi:hypothetical protein
MSLAKRGEESTWTRLETSSAALRRVQSHGRPRRSPFSYILTLDADMAALRHEFYETDERLTLSIFDKGADPAQVSVVIEPRKVRWPRIPIRVLSSLRIWLALICKRGQDPCS